ncbi:MAG: glucose-6-phosphate dehydrogenase assembly protein OpcA [Calditrichaeota bacterium]|nr:glucose-6-phosphate dehydrogenase assembly protein OpcA [Calditrichota bacterium]
MSGESTLVPLSAPQEVDVAKIEQELEAIWRDAESGTQPVTRATAFNLVLVCDHGSESKARELIPELALVHPTRTMLIVLNESAPAAQRAWVSADCRKLEGENRQICTETIVLEMDGAPEPRTSSLINSLSLGSLATAVVWHESLPLIHPLLLALTRTCERVITCATDHLAPASSMKPWFDLYESSPEECVVTDLLWAELSGFRGAVAELFDECPPVSTLREVRIHSQGEKLTCGALLIASWIAATLDWELQSVSLHGKRPAIECRDDRRIVFYPEGPKADPGIEFLFDDEFSAAVVRTGADFTLTCGGHTHTAHVRESDMLTLLTHELHAWGRDPRMDKSARMAHLWLPELLFS